MVLVIRVLAIIAPISGPLSDYGVGVQNGVGLALDEATIAFNFSVYDSQCTMEKSTVAMKEAIANRAQAVIGDVCSGASLSVLPLANAAQVIMISPTATSTALSMEDFFRTCPTDNYQGQ